MSLKCYKLEIQDYKKPNSGDLLLGIQIAQSEWLLPIYGAVPIVGSAITSINLQGLDIYGTVNSTEILATNLISYDNSSSQYIIDRTNDVDLNDGIYQIEFTNSDSETFLTEPFKIDSNVNTHWILSDGVWNDNGIWNDSKVWID